MLGSPHEFTHMYCHAMSTSKGTHTLPVRRAQVVLNLEQPSLIIRKKGRPSNVLPKEEGRRVAGFIDELKAANASQVVLTEQTVGAAAVKNPGGKGVKKSAPTCSRCGQVGHRFNRCPLPPRDNSGSAMSTANSCVKLAPTE